MSPVKSSFYLGRSVGAGKIAKRYNPYFPQLPHIGYGWFRERITFGSVSRARTAAKKLLDSHHVAIVPLPNRRYEIWYSEIRSSEVESAIRRGQWRTSQYLDFTLKRRREVTNPKRFDPIWEELNEEDEEMIVGINPHWLKTYAKKHGGTYTRRVLPSGLIKHTAKFPEGTLDRLGLLNPRIMRKQVETMDGILRKHNLKRKDIFYYQAKDGTLRFLIGNLDYRIYRTGDYAVYELPQFARNPILESIGSAAVTGVGIGAGFKTLDLVWNKLGLPRVKKNPRELIALLTKKFSGKIFGLDNVYRYRRDATRSQLFLKRMGYKTRLFMVSDGWAVYYRR